MNITEQERKTTLTALRREFDGRVSQIERAIEKIDVLGSDHPDGRFLTGKCRQWRRDLRKIQEQIVSYGGKERTIPAHVLEATENTGTPQDDSGAAKARGGQKKTGEDTT